MTPTQAADATRKVCFAATEANLTTSSRSGQVIHLTSDNCADVLISADLHGHRENFARLLELADLDCQPRRHLVLQEVCHGGPVYHPGACRSHAMLEDVARLKARYPERVHFLLSNHELAELTSFPISKDGKMLSLLFRLGMSEIYQEAVEDVHAAYRAFIGSCPLAIRVGPDVLLTHSAPERVVEDGFDPGLFHRPLTPRDLDQHGAAFRLVWGRDYREENARAFAEMMHARVLIHGHTPCPQGFAIPNRYQVILDCIGRPACYALLSLDQAWDLTLVRQRILSLESACVAA